MADAIISSDRAVGKILIAAPVFQKPRLAIIDGVVTVTSLVVANAFDRPHDQVLQTIGDLLSGLPDKAWCNQHFQYRDLAGDPIYRLTRDAFVMLVATFISFTDRKARVESLYLNAFDILEGGGKPDAKAQLPDLPVRSTRLAAPNRNLISSRSSLPVYREPKVIQPSAKPPEQVAVSPPADVPPVFQFDSRTVRTSVEGDEVWFVAKDVFETLELVWKGGDSLKPIPEDWRVLRSFRSTLKNQHGSQGTQEKDLICLNFKAVCKVAFRSNKPEADRFTNWAAEVIDTLRKTGRYEIPKPAPVTAPANLIPGLNIGEDEFFLHVYNALGRENGKVTLLIQLVKMGGIDKWITATAQKIVEAANGKISKSSVHYNAKRLIDEGLIDHKSHQYYVFGEALRTRIKHPMLQNTTGMLALPNDPAKSNGSGHGGGATTLH